MKRPRRTDFTVPLPEAARVLGLSEDETRGLIQTRKLLGWVRAGVPHVLPESLEKVRARLARLAIDFTGHRAGEWLVLGREVTAYGVPGWRCRCSCGVERVVKHGSLVWGDSKSCGHRSR